MITSEILNIGILNLQNNLSQIKVVEDKGAIKDFKDIVNEKIDIKLNENLNIKDNTVDNLLKDLNELLSVINSSLQIANVSKKDTDQDKILLLPIMKNTQSIVVNETSNEVYGENLENSELLNKLFTKKNELNSKDIQVLNRLFTKENQSKIEGIEVQNLESKQLNKISLEDLSSLKKIVVSSLDKVKTEPDNILAVLSVIVEKLQSTVINKRSNESYGEDFNNSELLNKLFTKENELNSKDTQLLNRLVSINKEPNSNVTENLDFKVTPIKNKEVTELKEVLDGLITELNGGKLEKSLKKNPEVVNQISNITKELDKLERKQLDQISLENLSSLKEIVVSSLDKVKTEPDNVLEVLSPIMEKLQSIVVDKTSNENYVEDSKNSEFLNKLFTKENELNSKDTQFLNRLMAINNEPNSNITENLDSKITSSKNKEVKELGEVFTKLVIELNGGNQEESLKQNPQVVREISNITKELEKIEPKQLEQVSLEDLSLIKEMVKSALSMIKGSQSKKPLKENLLSANNDINVEYVDFAKAKEYLKEDLSANRLRLKLVENQGNGEIGSVKDEIILNKNKEESLLKKIISGSEKNNEHTLMFTQRFSEMKNINQVKNELVINKNTMLNDVVKTIKYMAENNERTLTVKMNPKDLGEITIKIVAQGESMKATITAASRDTAILLNANEMDIKKMLEAQGIKISEVNISLYNDDTTFFRDQAGFGRQNESHRQNQNQNRTVSNKELDDEKLNEALDNTNNINMFA